MSPKSIPRVFVDTDVCFDIISKRDPHFNDSIGLLNLVLKGQINLYISENTISTLIYLSEVYKIKNTASKISKLVMSCEVVAGGKQIILNALYPDFKDKEDAIQYFIALRNDLDYFITRNLKDYKKHQTSIPVYSPKEFLKSI